ncbi:MAG: exodeoxyribonuclease VII large subunit, partial [Candidatus Glassbacteria bacterium]|nr:exodeoxyribonuclease VII large subunit [Candidatus Glassbacteria bacterium]
MDFKIYKVGELTRLVKDLVEESFPPLWVEGEVSNFVHHGSGHMYFSLKDEEAVLRAVFFRQYNSRLLFRPENGMQVLARGTLTVYERNGQYQLMVSEMRPSGTGALQLAFEQLKARLEAEGLFADERKRPLPVFPRVVGVVTSPTGAAVRDIISVISRRCPPARIVIYPVRVQGEGAAAEIAGAIRAFGRWGGADVLIVGRGGGSLEDLWAFNEEAVARAIFDSPIPVISAVGHQTDFTIADFTADLRAPTPSAAAEYAVPEAAELVLGLEEAVRRLISAQRYILDIAGQRLDGLEREISLKKLASRLDRLARERLVLAGRLKRAVLNRLETARLDWARLCGALDALNPAAVLGRGFSIVRTAGGQVVSDSAQVSTGQEVEVLLSRGGL